jgi:hypothetical protein
MLSTTGEKKQKGPDSRAFSLWRDPDSNRGHHDFQSCGAGSRTTAKSLQNPGIERRAQSARSPQIPVFFRRFGRWDVAHLPIGGGAVSLTVCPGTRPSMPMRRGRRLGPCQVPDRGRAPATCARARRGADASRRGSRDPPRQWVDDIERSHRRVDGHRARFRGMLERFERIREGRGVTEQLRSGGVGPGTHAGARRRAGAARPRSTQ